MGSMKLLRIWAKRLTPLGLLIRLRQATAVYRTMDHPSRSIVLAVDTDPEHRTRLHACREEPATVAWIESHVNPGQIFYDIGANVGCYALVAAKIAKARVYAFEPTFMNYAQLCRNILVNGCENLVTALPIGLGADTGLKRVRSNDMPSGAGVHKLGHTGQYTALSFRLDDFCKAFDIPVPDHFKIDVDGDESDIIAGGRDTLSHAISGLVEIFHQDDNSMRCFPLLESLGFAPESKAVRRRRSDNVVFTRHRCA